MRICLSRVHISRHLTCLGVTIDPIFQWHYLVLQCLVQAEQSDNLSSGPVSVTLLSWCVVSSKPKCQKKTKLNSSIRCLLRNILIPTWSFFAFFEPYEEASDFAGFCFKIRDAFYFWLSASVIQFCSSVFSPHNMNAMPCHALTNNKIFPQRRWR